MKLSESSSRAVAYGLTWHLTFHLHPIPSDLVEDVSIYWFSLKINDSVKSNLILHFMLNFVKFPSDFNSLQYFMKTLFSALDSELI